MKSTSRQRSAGTSLHRDVARVITDLRKGANSFNKVRRTRHVRTQWIARGRQRVLWQVADRLSALSKASKDTLTLYLALKEYLFCLEKSVLDAEEEKGMPASERGLLLVQWRAEGELQELLKVVRQLSSLIQAHDSQEQEGYVLSLDGTHPIPVSSLENPSLSSSSPDHLVERIDEEPASLQNALLTLEETLSKQARVFVTISPAELASAEILLSFLDRMLYASSPKRLLLLPGSQALRTQVLEQYQQWISREDRRPLVDRYPLTGILAKSVPGGSLHLATVRELQVLIRSLGEHEASISLPSYDLLIVYGVASLTAPWQAVLTHMHASRILGFGVQTDASMLRFFDHHVTISSASPSHSSM